jgi:hypothetical protein
MNVEIELKPHSCLPGNILFQFSVQCHCSGYEKMEWPVHICVVLIKVPAFPNRPKTTCSGDGTSHTSRTRWPLCRRCPHGGRRNFSHLPHSLSGKIAVETPPIHGHQQDKVASVQEMSSWRSEDTFWGVNRVSHAHIYIYS